VSWEQLAQPLVHRTYPHSNQDLTSVPSAQERARGTAKAMERAVVTLLIQELPVDHERGGSEEAAGVNLSTGPPGGLAAPEPGPGRRPGLRAGSETKKIPHVAVITLSACRRFGPMG